MRRMNASAPRDVHYPRVGAATPCANRAYPTFRSIWASLLHLRQPFVTGWLHRWIGTVAVGNIAADWSGTAACCVARRSIDGASWPIRIEPTSEMPSCRRSGSWQKSGTTAGKTHTRGAQASRQTGVHTGWLACAIGNDSRIAQSVGISLSPERRRSSPRPGRVAPHESRRPALKSAVSRRS